MFVGSVVDDVALIDVAGASKLCTAGTNIDVTFLLEDEVGPAEHAIVARRLVPHRHMRRDLAVHQPLEQPCHAINGVAYKPLRPKIEATFDALHHRLGDRDLLFAIGARAFGVEDDPNLVVDEVVRIIGEERIDTFPDLCRAPTSTSRVNQRFPTPPTDYLRRRTWRRRGKT